MKTIALSAGAAASALLLCAVPGYGDARTRHHYRHTYSGCEAHRHQVARNGTVIGAVAGGVIGSQMAGRGSRTLGTVLGAGGGAVLGHHIAQRSHRCR